MMEYRSTRGGGAVDAPRALMEGLAADRGLYVPAAWPEFDWRSALQGDEYAMEARILEALMPGCADEEMIRRAYAGKFTDGQLCPLKAVGDVWAMELYHGPTSAFKDVALTMLPHLMSRARQGQGSRRVSILTATSGDTGKAALEGFHDVEGTGIAVFYPEKGVSLVQRLQMATQEGRNVRVCAVRGNFDDCQSAVKEAFLRLSAQLPPEEALSSANSINIGRLMPQITYYFACYAELCRRGAIRLGETVNFSVPTGNFGDILAGYYAKKLGLPVGRLLCASNEIHVLTDFFRTGVYDKRRPFRLTTSPSMDILVSSNLERLLFDGCGEDAGQVRGFMERLEREGSFCIGGDMLRRLRESFEADYCTEEETAEEIARLWRERRYLCDPHSAVGFACGRRYREQSGDGRPMVVLSTASPFKFPAAVLAALGEREEGDEFAGMARLAALTGQTPPPALAALREKRVLHRDVIDREEIVDYVARWLREEGAPC